MIMQSEAEDCGVACLAMVLAHYKKYVSIEDIRTASSSSRDGTNAHQICTSAKKFGLKSNATSCSLGYLKKNCTYPAILHWSFNHFVVLDGFKGYKAIINDPARGRLLIDPQELSDSFTGICIEFEKEKNFTTGGKPITPFEYFKSLIRMQGGAENIYLLSISAFLASIPAAALPYFHKLYLDKVLTDEFQKIPVFFLFLSLLIIYQTIAELIFSKIKRWYKNSLKTSTAVSHMAHCLRLPLYYFEGHYSADLLLRNDENEFIIDTITEYIVSIFSSIILIFLYIAIMLKYNYLIILATIPVLLFEIASFHFINKHLNQIIAQTIQNESKITETTINGIEMIETIKALGAENGFFATWDELKIQNFNIKAKHARTQTLSVLIPSMVNNFSNFLILALGVFAISKGEISIGMLMAFQFFFSRLLIPTQNFFTQFNQVNRLKALITKRIDINTFPEDVELGFEDIENTDEPSGKIEFKNVCFGYSRFSPPILPDLSFSIEKGEKIAFVGLSGSGKTTIFKLLLGLYQPWNGEILFDGKPRSHFNHNALTKSISAIGQSNIFFNSSISENISMWNDDLKQEEIIECCKKARIHDTITRRAKDYSETIAENGTNFSQGELQRIEVARLLTSNANIMLIDEATGALDCNTETKVLQSIFDRNLTTIIISHRVSAIKDTDRIFVLDKGRIVEEGTHESLFKAGGLYSKLVTSE